MMQEKRNHSKKVHDDRARKKLAEEKRLKELGGWAILSPEYQQAVAAIKAEALRNNEKHNLRPPLESSHKLQSNTLVGNLQVNNNH